MVISAVLLIPCFWQSRIQAGDLSSHLYNAWLGTEIQAGRGGSLTVSAPATNVLFDYVLLGLMRLGGPGVAERVSVAGAVLILFWGAMAWLRAVTGKDSRFAMPCLVMLSYGWVFHVGLFNFYLSCGLVFWALALAWPQERPRLTAAGCVLALGYTAHALPVLWGCALLAYVWTARRLPGAWKVWLPLPAIAAILAGRMFVVTHYRTASSAHQALEMWGIDQFWVYGAKYALPVVLVGFLWGAQMIRLMKKLPGRLLAVNVPLQFCVVMAIGVVAAPTRIELPGYRMPLTMITERMTLPLAVLICVMLSQVRPARWLPWGLAAVAVLQFSFLYADARALNWWEDEVVRAIAALPRGSRLVSALNDPTTRGLLWNHAIDRPCIGRCYSYQNYEPGSFQFRIRSTGPNGIVMHEPRDAAAAQHGEYVVKATDLPLYQVIAGQDRRLSVVGMSAGERMQATALSIVPAWW
ncbi:hypothetical protein [Paludibaculum fermentans]|uniref:hypothetical protein n=1 Tax=Paludibaculum fermentans TaxID=1473598 RepID=UPI003EBDEBDA